MQRLVSLIAIIFAFASVMGATTAHAHRYVATPIVVLNVVDAENVAIPVMVEIQRGQIDLGAGITMPCGPYHAIAAHAAPALPAAPEADMPVPQLQYAMPFGPAEILLRPPIKA